MFWENAKPFIAQETINGFRMKVYDKRPRTLYETFEKSVSRYPDKLLSFTEVFKLPIKS